jgi:nicotinate phosphoribosyltransferase
VPVLDTAYKLVEYAGKAKMKLSESKSTLPGQKQVYRERSGGRLVRDVIALSEEGNLQGEPLLVKVMEKGRRVVSAEPLDQCRARCKTELDALPDHLQTLSKGFPEYPVELSAKLSRLKTSLCEAETRLNSGA